MLGTSAAATAMCAVAADHLTKAAAATLGETGPILPVGNRGFALGVAELPLASTVVISAGILVLYGSFLLRYARRRHVGEWAPGLAIGGAAANLLDRILFGEVRDFIVGPGVIFNVADAAVVVGLVCLFTVPHLCAGSAERRCRPASCAADAPDSSVNPAPCAGPLTLSSERSGRRR